MIIVRITMKSLIEKRIEVMQTLLSMIEPTENEKGCLSFRGFQDIENKNGFDLIAEWKTQEDLDQYLRSDRFSVLLGTKSLLCDPPQIQIHTVSNSQGMETVNAARGKKPNWNYAVYGKFESPSSPLHWFRKKRLNFSIIKIVSLLIILPQAP